MRVSAAGLILLLSCLPAADAFSSSAPAPCTLALRAGGARFVSMAAPRAPEAAKRGTRKSTAAAPGCAGQGRNAMTRGGALLSIASGALLCLLPRGAPAFDNRSAPKASNPPSPGEPAAGVGMGNPGEGGTLAKCWYAPNCFSPYGGKDGDPDHYYPPWRTTKGKDEAMADLLRAVEAYPPGQEDIDGGGWKVERREEGYLWVVYESAIMGYRDDLELAIMGGGEVQVRSASRLGYTESGVNSKRVNWFVDYLSKDPAWTCQRISKKTHPRYFRENLIRYLNPQPQD